MLPIPRVVDVMYAAKPKKLLSCPATTNPKWLRYVHPQTPFKQMIFNWLQDITDKALTLLLLLQANMFLFYHQAAWEVPHSRMLQHFEFHQINSIESEKSLS